MNYRRIGNVGYSNGCLYVMEHENKYYWLVEEWGTNFERLSNWYEIDKELYDSLIAYQTRITT